MTTTIVSVDLMSSAGDHACASAVAIPENTVVRVPLMDVDGKSWSCVVQFGPVPASNYGPGTPPITLEGATDEQLVDELRRRLIPAQDYDDRPAWGDDT